MRNLVKVLIKKIYFSIYSVIDKGKNNIVHLPQNKNRDNLRIYIYGSNNIVNISPECIMRNVVIMVYGDNNNLSIEYESKFQKGKIELHDGASINIDHNSTFQEIDFNIKSGKCNIKEDCMFSYGIIVRNHDGHKIVNLDDNTIYNTPGDIEIGKHVWVGQNVTILKNSQIEDGSIIGCNALVSGHIESNTIAVGIPARSIRQSATWIRH